MALSDLFKKPNRFMDIMGELGDDYKDNEIRIIIKKIEIDENDPNSCILTFKYKKGLYRTEMLTGLIRNLKPLTQFNSNIRARLQFFYCTKRPYGMTIE